MRAYNYHHLGEYESAASDYQVMQLSPTNAVPFNNLAWAYVTGPSNFCSPGKALPLALKAVELTGKTNHNYLNTLGVVYYRLGQYTNAIETLEAGIKLDSARGTAFDFFFLAMAQQRLGEAKASGYFAKAVKWAADQPSLLPGWKEELESFRAEAEAVLGIPGK